MTDKKLTDNEIIKALEDEMHLAEYVDSDYCSNVKLEIIKSALDLITRQQTETENLKVENQSLRSAANSLKMHYEEAQAEIERLGSCVKTEKEVREIAKRTMEPLVKEITREQIDIAVKLAKTEAYIECIEKVKNYIKTHCNPYGKFDYDTIIKTLNFIDNLAKEMEDKNHE